MQVICDLLLAVFIILRQRCDRLQNRVLSHIATHYERETRRLRIAGLLEQRIGDLQAQHVGAALRGAYEDAPPEGVVAVVAEARDLVGEGPREAHDLPVLETRLAAWRRGHALQPPVGRFVAAGDGGLEDALLVAEDGEGEVGDDEGGGCLAGIGCFGFGGDGIGGGAGFDADEGVGAELAEEEGF